MYTVSSSIECIYWSLRLLYWVSWLWKFVCEFSDVFFSLCLSYYVFYMWEMGNLFLGTPIIVFSIITFIDDLTILHDLIWVYQCSFIFFWFICSLFHSPCLHCFLFISIYIPCSIFSTHHSCTSHWQFNIFFLLFHHWYIHFGFFLPHQYIHIE